MCGRFERLQPIRPARRMPNQPGNKMEILSEAHGRSTEQNQPLKILRAEKLWRSIEKKSSVPIRQHFVLSNAHPFSPRPPLFYSSRREAVSPVYITLILCLFGQRYSSILPTEYCYLGFDFCANLSTIQQKGVPTCKGRFTHAIHGLRLGTVFFTTPLELDSQQIVSMPQLRFPHFVPTIVSTLVSAFPFL